MSNTESGVKAVARSPSLRELFRVYLRIGNFTFGGGGATVAALQRELVTVREWINTAQFGLCYALARVTPGTNLLAFCTATGWLLRRWRGALVAVLAASVPSCAVVALLTRGFDAWTSHRWVQIAIDGALASSVGILLASFWLTVRPYITRGRWIESIVIVSGSISLSLFINLSPLMVLLLAGVVGFLWKGRGES
jgi:chromate transporter